jgi:hypothetical protein
MMIHALHDKLLRALCGGPMSSDPVAIEKMISIFSPKLIHLMDLQHAMDDISRRPLHPMHLYVSLDQGLYAYKRWSFSRLPQHQ